MVNSFLAHSRFSPLTLMESYIVLEDMRFFARHGVAPQERLVGNEFILNLKLKTDVSRAIDSDDVSHTVSYADVYQCVKNEMETPSRLLEHVAGRIARRLFRDFPGIEEIELNLMKRNPPMGADIKSAGVELRIRRHIMPHILMRIKQLSLSLSYGWKRPDTPHKKNSQTAKASPQ